MEKSQQKDLTEFEKLRKRSSFYFFCYFFSIIAGVITILVSFSRIMVVEGINGKPLGYHYEVVFPILIVCFILCFIFWQKHKKASDELTAFFKKASNSMK